MLTRSRRRQPAPDPGAWEQLAFVWPVVEVPKPKRPKLTVLPPERPRTRADCLPGGWNAQRPCAYVACRHHNYLEVDDRGSIRMNHPDLEPHELEESCSLDVADRGEHTQPQVGAFQGMSPQRVEQLERGGLLKLKMTGAAEHLRPEGASAPSRRSRIMTVMRDFARRGERYVTLDMLHDALGVDGDARAKYDSYQAVRALVRDGYLAHDGGNESRRLYWLTED